MIDHKRIDQIVNKDYDERVHHKRPTGFSPVALGAIVAVLIAALSYLAYTKDVPFIGESFELKARFDSSVTLRETSPVRIAGVNVGEVTEVARSGEGAEVTFTLDPEGRPIHDDATVAIRPRLFLEGNLFLDVSPGSPSAPSLDEGETIPATQTASFVQLDEILTSLQQDDRAALSQALRGYGAALTEEPTAEQDAEQDPDVQGESAAEALNDAFRYGGRAGKGSAQVTEALRGTEPGDLERLLEGGSETFAALARSEQALGELIVNFNETTGALANESTSLQATIRELAPTVEQAEPSLAELNATLPPLRTFAGALRPAIGELEPTIRFGNPWLRQADPLMSRAELGGLAVLLRRSSPDLASTTIASTELMRSTDLLSRCTSEVLVPTGNIVIEDDFSTGIENYKEFFLGAAQQAGESQGFDGNGSYLRVQASGGDVLARAENPDGGSLDTSFFSNTIAPPIGTQPTLPDEPPPVRSDVPCHENAVPNLNGPAAQVGPPSPKAIP